MEKETVLKAFYTSQITAMIDNTKDIALLDLIYKLLIEENKGDKTKC